MDPVTNRILVIVDDLFFASKIGETAKRSGIAVNFASTEAGVLEVAALKPSLVIVDLNLNRLQPLPLIALLKSHPDLQQATVLGFVSHVQGDLKLQAEQAGCDVVLPRSAFSQNLPEILKRHSGS
jgi:CheY-like chemotaxis protein